jgi:hypothetical protein
MSEDEYDDNDDEDASSSKSGKTPIKEIRNVQKYPDWLTNDRDLNRFKAPTAIPNKISVSSRKIIESIYSVGYIRKVSSIVDRYFIDYNICFSWCRLQGRGEYVFNLLY